MTQMSVKLRNRPAVAPATRAGWWLSSAKHWTMGCQTVVKTARCASGRGWEGFVPVSSSYAGEKAGLPKEVKSQKLGYHHVTVSADT